MLIPFNCTSIVFTRHRHPWRVKFKQLFSASVLWLPVFNTINKCLIRRTPVHITSLVRALLVVFFQVGFQILLHLIHRFVPFTAAHDTKVFIEQGAVEPFDKAIALRPSDFSCAMLNAFQLQEELVGMTIGPATILSAIIAKDCFNLDLMLLKVRQHVFVEHVNGGYR